MAVKRTKPTTRKKAPPAEPVVAPPKPVAVVYVTVPHDRYGVTMTLESLALVVADKMSDGYMPFGSPVHTPAGMVQGMVLK